jgi:hypothetical protein
MLAEKTNRKVNYVRENNQAIPFELDSLLLVWFYIGIVEKDISMCLKPCLAI